MFDYLEWHKVGQVIVRSIEKAIKNKTVTKDFADFMEGATQLSCSDFGAELATLIESEEE